MIAPKTIRRTRLALTPGTLSGEGPARYSASRAGQPLVADARRPSRLGPQRAQPVLLVLGVVALEPDHPAVALEGQDVGRDPVQEPAVVADHGGAAGEA